MLQSTKSISVLNKIIPTRSSLLAVEERLVEPYSTISLTKEQYICGERNKDIERRLTKAFELGRGNLVVEYEFVKWIL
ncbi:hypothetical protein WN51_12967 [Melipona quadrifasciata]|uniref:Uncharacterized protein n=1 Tax=Melipona quadrifasciata TaxID=166423 RepID=A0A0N0BKF0_9HYME|nr:hypothetical protein WN51_12967 [Melipona quadrifasciata]